MILKRHIAESRLELGFNVNYLIDVLNVIKTKNVQISLKDANSSALLMPENDSSSSYVVMPLRLVRVFLDKLYLRKIRNIKEAVLSLSPRTNVIIGENASGKTQYLNL
jgi:hypothetical protein